MSTQLAQRIVDVVYHSKSTTTPRYRDSIRDIRNLRNAARRIRTRRMMLKFCLQDALVQYVACVIEGKADQFRIDNVEPVVNEAESLTFAQAISMKTAPDFRVKRIICPGNNPPDVLIKDRLDCGKSLFISGMVYEASPPRVLLKCRKCAFTASLPITSLISIPMFNDHNS